MGPSFPSSRLAQVLLGLELASAASRSMRANGCCGATLGTPRDRALPRAVAPIPPKSLVFGVFRQFGQNGRFRAGAEVGVLSGTTGCPGVPLQHLLRVPRREW